MVATSTRENRTHTPEPFAHCREATRSQRQRRCRNPWHFWVAQGVLKAVLGKPEQENPEPLGPSGLIFPPDASATSAQVRWQDLPEGALHWELKWPAALWASPTLQGSPETRSDAL